MLSHRIKIWDIVAYFHLIRFALDIWTCKIIYLLLIHFIPIFIQFSKAAGQIKEAISNLPVATEEDDTEEAMSLNSDSTVMVDEGGQTLATNEGNNGGEEADPFGLDALIPGSTKKGEKLKAKSEAAVKIRKEEEEEETKRFLKSQRVALITCLEIAARRYKIPW